MEYKKLVDAALGHTLPDLYLTGGKVFNVFTGEMYEADVTIKDGFIAYVGNDLDKEIKESCASIDLKGYNLLPGFIEPHAHPTQLHDTVDYTRLLVRHGITSIVADCQRILESLGVEDFIHYIQRINESTPVKVFWLIRIFSESSPSYKRYLLSLEELHQLLQLPEVLGIGETTRWISFLQGEAFPLKALQMTQKAGKRPDGHTSGASGKKLAALAAAGISGCHESITVEDALKRLRSGMHVILRHSSQRPDIDNFLPLLKNSKIDLSRLMLTNDGASPSFIGEGWDVASIAESVVEKGVDPLVALRLITSNPAAYFRIDHEIGSIAPGRAADIVVTEGFNFSCPEMVFIDGKLIKGKSTDTFQLSPCFKDSPLKNIEKKYFASYLQVNKEVFKVPVLSEKTSNDKNKLSFPVIEIVNSVITRRKEMDLPIVNGEAVPEMGSSSSLLKVCLLDMLYGNVSCGFVKGLAKNIEGFASSLSCSQGVILTLGFSDEAMALAANRVLNLGGGIVAVENGKMIWELKLELVGELTETPIEELLPRAKALEDLMNERGYCWGDFLHTMIFLSTDFFPYIRITREGVLDVMNEEIIYPAKKGYMKVGYES